jgi:endonuclease-3
MNEIAMKKIGWLIARMHKEASKRKAPVFEAEEKTKNDPFKILVFTMLSARTRDETTIRIVENLFKTAQTPREIARLGNKKLEKLLYGVGFYHVKAKNLIRICKFMEDQGGHVPDTLQELLELPGIGRKTANIVLARAFGKSSLGVDVHVHRISNRLGIVKTKKPEETEEALLRLIPEKHLRTLNRNFVAFGQTLCQPRKPMCEICPINQVCYRIGVKEPCGGCKFGKK